MQITDSVRLKSAVHVAPRQAVTASTIGRAALFWRAPVRAEPEWSCARDNGRAC
jgi:hypothetical protein